MQGGQHQGWAVGAEGWSGCRGGVRQVSKEETSAQSVLTGVRPGMPRELIQSVHPQEGRRPEGGEGWGSVGGVVPKTSPNQGLKDQGSLA